MSLTYLPAREPVAVTQVSLEEHPMRQVTTRIAHDRGAWDARVRGEVREFFDHLASEWVLRSTAERRFVVEDALDRGGARLGGDALEVGAGSGLISPLLRRQVSSLTSIDLSLEMLREIGDPEGPLVRADASVLPFPDGCFDLVVAVNMFLFAEEYCRVLRRDGALLWISTLGERTPIYLHPQEVASCLGDGFEGVWSDAGGGRWAVLWRRSVGPT